VWQSCLVINFGPYILYPHIDVDKEDNKFDIHPLIVKSISWWMKGQERCFLSIYIIDLRWEPLRWSGDSPRGLFVLCNNLTLKQPCGLLWPPLLCACEPLYTVLRKVQAEIERVNWWSRVEPCHITSHENALSPTQWFSLEAWKCVFILFAQWSEKCNFNR